MGKEIKSVLNVPKYKYKWKCQQKIAGVFLQSLTGTGKANSLRKIIQGVFCGFDSTESPAFVNIKFNTLKYLQNAL